MLQGTVEIEKAQEQQGDAIKCLDKEVKDSIAALQTDVSELASHNGGNGDGTGYSSQEGDSSEQRGIAKVLDPRPNAG